MLFLYVRAQRHCITNYPYTSSIMRAVKIYCSIELMKGGISVFWDVLLWVNEVHGVVL